MAHELVAHSSDFEPFVPSQPNDLLSEMNILGGLEDMTRQSVNSIGARAQLAQSQAAIQDLQAPLSAGPENQKPSSNLPTSKVAQAAARALASNHAHAQSQLPTHVPPPKPVFGTKRAEYRPALEDQSLVDALLSLHQAKTNSKAALQRTNSQFQPQAIPQVTASAKSFPMGSKRPPGVTQSVLSDKTRK